MSIITPVEAIALMLQITYSFKLQQKQINLIIAGTLTTPRVQLLVDEIRTNPVEYFATPHPQLFRRLPSGIVEEYRHTGKWTKVPSIPPPEVLPFDWQQSHYQARLVERQEYRCSLRGQCELSEYGVSLAECEQRCAAAENIDPLFEVLGYDLTAIERDGSNSDVMRVYRMFSDVPAIPPRARYLLLLLSDEDQNWPSLREAPELTNYFQQRYHPYDLFLRDVANGYGLRLQTSYPAELHRELAELARGHDP